MPNSVSPETPSALATLVPSPLSPAEQQQAGRSLRQEVPRSAHAVWQPSSHRRHPLELLEQSNQGRIPDLIPLRYQRMLQSPFTFLRGSAILMAADLATTLTTGIRVQSCGDAHLSNFGGFATPERNLVFDLTDFDETLPAPWEWDVKRLATSIWIAGQDAQINLSERACRQATRTAVRAYRLAMAEHAAMHRLQVWYNRLDTDWLVQHAPNPTTRQLWAKMTQRAFTQTLDRAFLELTHEVSGQRRLIDQSPELFHPPDSDQYFQQIQTLFQQYCTTLQSDRQFLLNRYQLVDVAMKVVGVGSVGTHCGVALLMAGPQDPLLLQYKQARPSVLEPYIGQSPLSQQGQRIVSGQRLMQAASDIFLGWTGTAPSGEFYFRQLRDMKTSVKLKGISANCLEDYAEICGQALARAHARSGEPALISGYLGKSDPFDQAVTEFAIAYGQQIQQDYQMLVEAKKAGQIPVK